MGLGRTIAKIAGVVVGVGAIGALGASFWAKGKAAERLSKHYETHRVEVPVPFPLSEDELTALREEKAKALPPPAEGEAAPDPLAGVDLNALALERAQARGKHLVEARYACIECHGRNFGGGVMIDAPPIGKILGVNITTGKGGQVAKYTTADWDRIVRHGVKPDGLPAAMPSEDFFRMSDQELSDIIAYIRSVPPVDGEVARPTLGPVGTMLMATGGLPVSAERLPDHNAAHVAAPPKAEVSVEFGKHLVQICSGCHSANLAGGPVPGGDPSWPPAKNLTPHADGLKGWAYEDFVTALREGKSKNGMTLRPPMANMVAYGKNITETELKAMWAYLQTIPPVPTPK